MTKARKPGEPRLDLIVEPADYMILTALPPEGSMAFGAFPDGKTVHDIQPLVGDGTVPISYITSRLRSLTIVGWTTKVKGLGTSGKHVWQRTKAGEEALEKWSRDHGSH